jgi:hypothetical protein
MVGKNLSKGGTKFSMDFGKVMEAGIIPPIRFLRLGDFHE